MLMLFTLTYCMWSWDRLICVFSTFFLFLFGGLGGRSLPNARRPIFETQNKESMSFLACYLIGHIYTLFMFPWWFGLYSLGHNLFTDLCWLNVFVVAFGGTRLGVYEREAGETCFFVWCWWSLGSTSNVWRGEWGILFLITRSVFLYEPYRRNFLICRNAFKVIFCLFLGQNLFDCVPWNMCSTTAL